MELLAKLLGLIKWTGAAGKAVSLQGQVYGHWYAPFAAPKNASLLFALTHLAIMLAILYWMYRRRIFLKA